MDLQTQTHLKALRGLSDGPRAQPPRMNPPGHHGPRRGPSEILGECRSATCTRRRFIQLVPVGAGLALDVAAKPKPAPPPDPSTFPHLDERDPHARAVGYVEDAARVDRRSYPKFVPGSTCDNCALYRIAAQSWSECTLFPRKLVAARGWCDAYVKRTAP